MIRKGASWATRKQLVAPPYLQQCRCRVSLQALPELVDLIEQKYGIVHPDSLQAIDYSPRHAAHVEDLFLKSSREKWCGEQHKNVGERGAETSSESQSKAQEVREAGEEDLKVATRVQRQGRETRQAEHARGTLQRAELTEVLLRGWAGNFLLLSSETSARNAEKSG
ncbi:UNVERIFIED_CONTAM: hypothetical protein K2H54_040195 [Gekko kuhli]